MLLVDLAYRADSEGRSVLDQLMVSINLSNIPFDWNPTGRVDRMTTRGLAYAVVVRLVGRQASITVAI